MAESVFAMRLVNFRSVTCYTDQNANFGALNLFTSGKKVEIKLQDVYQLKDLDFDFVLQHLKLTRNLIEEDSSQCLKILS